MIVKSGKVTVASYKYDKHFYINRSNTVKQLKEQIAKFLEISENELILKRSPHNGQELKNLNESLSSFNVNDLSIYVEYGQPLKESNEKIKD